MNNTPPDLSKAYADLGRRIILFMTTSIVALVLLVVVVEVEIESRSRELHGLDTEIAKIELDQLETANSEKRQSIEFRDNVYQTSRNLLELPVLDIEALRTLRNAARRSGRAATERFRSDSVRTFAEDLKKLGETIRASQEIEKIESTKFLAELGQLVSDAESTAIVLDSNIENRADDQSQIDTILETKKKLEREPQSVPSPFGTFRIHPRLALMLIAVFCALVYVRLITLLNNLRTLSNELGGEEEDRRLRNIVHPVPLWYYPQQFAVGSNTVSASWRREFLGFIAHVAYVGFCVWIVVETFRLENQNPIWFSSHQGVQAILGLSAIVPISLLSWTVWKSEIFRRRISTESTMLFFSKRGIDVTRRKVIVGITVAVATLAGIVFSKRQNRPISMANVVQGNTGRQFLIQNKKTRVIHHSDVCVLHQPNQANSIEIEVLDNTSNLHQSVGPRILESLAAQSDGNTAITLLRAAITRSPYSFHLYDKLVRLYGRMKKYEEIHALLNDAVRNADIEIQRPGITKNRLHTLARVKSEFEMRLNKARQREHQAA